MKKRFFSNENGSALIFTILILFILSVLGSVLISVAMSNFKLIGHGNDYETAFFIADGAADEVIDEMEIISSNAEFYALSQIGDYADGIKEAYVTTHIDIVDEETVTTYSYEEKPSYIDALSDEYALNYLTQIEYNLVAPITENIEFDPDINAAFNEITPVTVEIISPDPFENLVNESNIQIRISGSYKGLRRDILLEYQIHVPPYTFNGNEAGPYILYDGFDERGSTIPGLELVSWKETNIN